MTRVPIFDLDGTLFDSDAALVAPFVALGIDERDVTFGHVLEHECARLGITVADYLSHYDTDTAAPFPGVVEVVEQLDRWAVCSNKVGVYGRAELGRLPGSPEAALFAEDFGGPKHLGPVLHALGLQAGQVVFVGDTDHDRRCAVDVGATFALAAWNPRAVAVAGDVVLAEPADLLRLLAERSAG